MEITEGIMKKFSVAQLVLKPPIRAGDVLDIEILFVSDTVPVQVKGYLTINHMGQYEPRVYPHGENAMNFTLSHRARKKLRAKMSDLIMQLRGELTHV
jgi:hypothetical protein